MTGTGKAMTNTPDNEQIDPNNLPETVIGTISPYLVLYKSYMSQDESSGLPKCCHCDDSVPKSSRY